MKIAVIKEENPFIISGASANRWRSLLEGLSANGAEINIIVLCGYRSPLERRANARAGEKYGIRMHYTYNFISAGLWRRRINKYVVQPLVRKFSQSRGMSIIEAISPDIVWIEKSYEALRLYDKLRRKLNHTYKTMIELSEYDDISVAGNLLQKRDIERTIRLFRERVIPLIDIFSVMTKSLMDHYQALSKKHGSFIHIPMTVDLSRFDNLPDCALKKPYMMYCGTLSNAKDGVDILIKAFAKISKTYSDMRLYLVGDTYPDMKKQKELISLLRLEDRIKYLGPKKRDEIPVLLKGSRILTLARPDSRQAQGGFPTKLGEYLATGNPVCVTKTGEIENYLTDNQSAFLAEPGDVGSFADALARALADRENAERVGRNGRIVAEEYFNMTKQAKKLFEFVKSNIEHAI